MNNIRQFNHEMFGSMSILIKDNNPYFPAADVAKVLGYSNPHKAINDHCRPEGMNESLVPTSGGQQIKKFISEGNLYRLISRSRLAEAEKFEKWIFDEVLPMIRKTGGYVSNEEMFLHTYLPHADEQTKMMFRATLETVRKQNEQISLMQPKADYFDALVDRNLLTNFRDTAKELEVGERQFVKWLLENKYLYRDKKSKLKPYSKFVPEIFKLKEYERNGRADVQTLVTPKGKETFRILMKRLVS